jgi:hypothetical protein
MGSIPCVRNSHRSAIRRVWLANWPTPWRALSVAAPAGTLALNQGYMQRDLTYFDEIVEGLVRTLVRVPRPDPSFQTDEPDPAHSWAPACHFKIGN